MCPQKEILSAYLDNEVEPPWNQRIREHLQRCARCRKIVDELKGVRELLHRDPEPDFRDSLGRVKAQVRQSAYGLQVSNPWPVPVGEPSGGVPLWKKKVTVPLPLAAATAALIVVLGAALGLFSSRTDLRQVSIRTGPAGMTEVQVAAPIEDLEQLLRSLDRQGVAQEVIITLPEEQKFMMIGEPRIVREAEYSRSQRW